MALDDENGNTPVDLTGCSWEILEPTDNSVSIEITNPTAGVSHFIIDKNTTRNFKTGSRTVRARLILSDGSAIAPSPIRYKVV